MSDTETPGTPEPVTHLWDCVKKALAENDNPSPRDIDRLAASIGLKLAASTIEGWSRTWSVVPAWERFEVLIKALGAEQDEDWRALHGAALTADRKRKKEERRHKEFPAPTTPVASEPLNSDREPVPQQLAWGSTPSAVPAERSPDPAFTVPTDAVDTTGAEGDTTARGRFWATPWKVGAAVVLLVLTAVLIFVWPGGEGEHVSPSAGTGKRLTGQLSQASTEDIVIENGLLAMAVSAVTEDNQLLGTTRGKVLDMTTRGRADQLDWINVGYASAAEPAGIGAWQQVTVRYDEVRVLDPGPDRAVLRATGSSTDFPALRVTTTYRIEPDQPWISTETMFSNTGAAPVTAWIGDSLDHDGAGQYSGIPGGGTIVAPYDSPRRYNPTEPWMGQTGADPQTYGLIYDAGYPGLTIQATENWVLSQLRVDIPAGGSSTLARRIVAIDNGGASDPFAVLSELYRA